MKKLFAIIFLIAACMAFDFGRAAWAKTYQEIMGLYGDLNSAARRFCHVAASRI